MCGCFSFTLLCTLLILTRCCSWHVRKLCFFFFWFCFCPTFCLLFTVFSRSFPRFSPWAPLLPPFFFFLHFPPLPTSPFFFRGGNLSSRQTARFGFFSVLIRWQNSNLHFLALKAYPQFLSATRFLTPNRSFFNEVSFFFLS